jgi:hypothetical protein
MKAFPGAAMPAQPSLYGVHPAVAYQQAIVDNLKGKSGRSLPEWLAHVKKAAPKGADAKALTAWLRSEGLGGTQAGIVAERALVTPDRHAFLEDTPEGYLKAAEAYVEAMYAGKKAPLRPLYDALLELSLGLGKDVMACPCATIVPIYRKNVIAQIKPTTQTRIDFGLSLGDPAGVKEKSGRLLDTGGFGKKDRITHRIEIRSLDDIDGFVRTWLAKAYARNA